MRCLLQINQDPIFDEGGCFYIAELENCNMKLADKTFEPIKKTSPLKLGNYVGSFLSTLKFLARWPFGLIVISDAVNSAHFPYNRNTPDLHFFVPQFFQLCSHAPRVPHMFSVPNPLDRHMLCQVFIIA